MQQAQVRAAELGNPEVQPAHLLLALIEDREGVIPSVLDKIGVPTERLESDLHQIEEKLPRVSGSTSQPGLSQALNKALEQAFREAANFKDEYVSTEHLLLGVAHAKGDAARDALVDAFQGRGSGRCFGGAIAPRSLARRRGVPRLFVSICGRARQNVVR